MFSQLWLLLQRTLVSPSGRLAFSTASSGKWDTHAYLAADLLPLLAPSSGAQLKEELSARVEPNYAFRTKQGTVRMRRA